MEELKDKSGRTRRWSPAEDALLREVYLTAEVFCKIDSLLGCQFVWAELGTDIEFNPLAPALIKRFTGRNLCFSFGNTKCSVESLAASR
jgi:hypothetical protein